MHSSLFFIWKITTTPTLLLFYSLIDYYYGSVSGVIMQYNIKQKRRAGKKILRIRYKIARSFFVHPVFFHTRAFSNEVEDVWKRFFLIIRRGLFVSGVCSVVF